MNPPFPSQEYGDDVRAVRLRDKSVLLVGTAHLSRRSCELVEQVITTERPDAVCVELDERRHQALTNRQSWENLDLKQVIKRKQLSTLLANLILASYQKRLGEQTGVSPGAELLQATTSARELDIPLILCDRDVRVTLKRAWRNTPWFKKGALLFALIGSFFEKTELDEEQLAALRKQDVLAGLIQELGDSLPDAKEALIDERDMYMAQKIREAADTASGGRVVAVMGAGHLEGVSRLLPQDNAARIPEISTVAPASRGWTIAAWAIPVLIVAALVATGFRHGADKFEANALFWFLVNGIPAGLGAAAAWGHPLTVAAAFFGAPFTSLSPLIGVGYVCAFVQVMARPPIVREFGQIHQDIGTAGGWWRNRLLRIFLVFFFSTLGSLLGTFLGGYHIFTSLFGV